jgi:MFS family permease
MVVASAHARGYAATAAIQGVWVLALTVTAPFRARILDRLGRERIIVPQTVVSLLILTVLATTAITPQVPLIAVMVIAGLSALASPSIDAVIRTTWRTIGGDEEEVKALHSYDSILEEFGFLFGPFLASVLMLAAGLRPALYLVLVAAAAGAVLALTTPEVRSALRTAQRTPVAHPAHSPPLPEPRTTDRVRRFLATLAGPIASRDLQRIVAPLIFMGTVFGVLAILVPALCAAKARPADAGFVLACISLGGVAGAFIYGALKLSSSLRMRQAALGVLFGAPLVFAFLADNPWVLAGLLALAGLAVTPLYINSYLMMDADIPPRVIHEANTWVPVGNDVGYLIGISIAGAIVGHGTGFSTALVVISAVAGMLVLHSLLQTRKSNRQTAIDDPSVVMADTATT